MGALTDNRKRCLVDHRLPFSPPNPNTSPLSPDPPPSKKPKLSPPSAVDRMAPPPPPSPPPPASLRRFPPPAPLSRPIHGPQRILRAFGLASYDSSRRSLINWSETNPMIESLTSRFAQSNSAAAEDLDLSGSDRRESSKVSDDGSLGLEEYKRLVVEAQEVCDATPKRRPEETSAQPDFELAIMVGKDAEKSDLYVLDRSIGDDGKAVLEATPVREGSVWSKRSPLYKDLYTSSSRKYGPLLNSIEFEVKLAEAKLSIFRIAREARLKKPKEDLSEPYAPLTSEEENDVKHALVGANRCNVLVRHEASCIDITREILQCLSYGAWLNDEVINLYLELLKERERREPKKFLKCHFHSTFFYKKLISGKSGYDFTAVKRWTSQRKLGYGLIECDKIFVPVHKEVHWCLAVINVKEKKFQYLDSLGGMDTMVLRMLARYFVDEAKDKSGKQIDTMSWKQEAVGNLPLQKNGWDCGMFMLKYIDFYSRGVGLNFSQEHMEYFRKRTIKEILRLRAE